MDPATLETQSVTIPLTTGLDLKTDSEAVQPPAMVRLENVSFFAPGAIAKDDGYIALAQTPETCVRLIEGSPSSLIEHSDDRLREYSETNDIWRALTPNASPLGSAAAERIDDTRIDYQRTFKCGDYASYGNTEAIIYSDSAGNIRAQVRDISTGAVITKDAVSELVVSAVTQTYVVTNDGYYVFAWVSAGNIRVSVWDPTSHSATAPTNLVTDNRSGNAPMDLISGTAAGDYWIAYSLTGGGRGIKVLKNNLHGGGSSSLTQGADTADQWIALGLDSSDGSVLCAYQSSTAGTKMFGLTSAAALRSASTIAAGDVAGARGTVVCHNTPTGMIVYEKSTSEVRRCLVAWAGSGGAASTLRSIFAQRLCHRAFQVEGTVYVGFAYFDQVLLAAANQRVLWTAAIDGTDPLYLEPVCSYLYDIIADPSTWVCSHVPLSTATTLPLTVSEYHFLAAVTDQKAGDPTTSAHALALCKFRLYEGQAVGVRGIPYVAGQMVYSGPGPCNASFMWAPSLGSSIAYSNVGGGGLVAGQSYQWQAVFSLRLPDGTIVRSIPSNTLTGTVSGGNNAASLSVSIPIFRGIGSAALQGVLEVYRTQAGPGSSFTKTGTSSVSTVLDAASPITVLDSASDPSIASNLLVYTTGGVLEAYPMPMVSNLCLHQNRLFAVDELSNEVRYTRDIVEGEAPAWHPTLAIALSGQNLIGKVLATSSNGLWVLGRDAVTGSGAIGLLLGDGPDDTGASSTYQLQRLENADVGPTHWRQVCATAAGIFFEDPFQGFHLLPPGGGTPQPVGFPVEAKRPYLSEGSQGSVLSVHALQDRKEIRCLLAHDTSQTMSNRLLVYHYDVGQWSTRQALGVPLDATVWHGLHVQVSDSGTSVGKHQFRRIASPSFKDRGTVYPMVFATGWIRTADFAGLQIVRSIYLVGRFKSACAVTANLYYDGDDVTAEAHVFSAADIADVHTGDTEIRLRIRPSKRRMERFRIEVTTDTTGQVDSCEGLQWNALRLEYGALRRGTRQRTTGMR